MYLRTKLSQADTICHLHLLHKSSKAQKGACLLCAFKLNFFGRLASSLALQSPYQYHSFTVTFLYKEQMTATSIRKTKF